MAAPRTSSGRGMYPPDTPITDMGLTPEEVAMLSQPATQLTKRNLLTLREITKQYRDRGEDKVVQVFDQRTGLHLAIADLDSIAHAFDHMQDRLNTHATVAAADVTACCCCSCCPCCCCTASVVLDAKRDR